MMTKKKTGSLFLVVIVAISSIMAPIYACAQGTETGKVLRIENISGTEGQQSKSDKVKREEAEGTLEMESLLEVLSDDTYKVTYVGTWEKAPTSRKTDRIGAFTNGGTLQGESPVYSYSYTENTYKNGKLIQTKEIEETMSSKNLSLCRTWTGCELTCKLKKDKIQYTPLKSGKEYTNHRVYLSYQVTMEDSVQQVDMTGQYIHQERKGLRLVPTVWSEDSDISLSEDEK